MPLIDPEEVRRKIVKALPARVRWQVGGSPLDFDFSRARKGLRPVGDADVNGFEIPEEWKLLYLFGEEDYAEGGGAAPLIGAHADTEQVFGLDVERDTSPLYLLNSDVERYVATFDAFDRALRRRKIHITEAARLAGEIDPAAFAAGEWRRLAEFVAAYEEDGDEGRGE